MASSSPPRPARYPNRWSSFRKGNSRDSWNIVFVLCVVAAVVNLGGITQIECCFLVLSYSLGYTCFRIFVNRFLLYNEQLCRPFVSFFSEPFHRCDLMASQRSFLVVEMPVILVDLFCFVLFCFVLFSLTRGLRKIDRTKGWGLSLSLSLQLFPSTCIISSFGVACSLAAL